MDDLISRQAAIRIAEQGQIQGFEWQIRKLLGMPSAEPKIIRCKDCRRYNGRPCGLVNWYNGKEDFCSRATERGDQDERTEYI